MQYERSGSERIIIRPRINGRANPNIDDLGGPENWQNHYIYESLTESDRNRLEAGNRVSPILQTYSLTDQQRELLESENFLRLEVRDGGDGNRRIEVYLGDDKVIDSFEYQVEDHDNPMTISGFRVWEVSGS